MTRTLTRKAETWRALAAAILAVVALGIAAPHFSAADRFRPLLRGRLEFSSVRLESASINLVKTGPISEPGHWNFEPLLNRNVIASFPSIHLVGDGFSGTSRINFKFGDTKSVFYLTSADVDVTPPATGSR